MQDQVWSPWRPLWPTPHSALGQWAAPTPNSRTQWVHKTKNSWNQEMGTGTWRSLFWCIIQEQFSNLFFSIKKQLNCQDQKLAPGLLPTATAAVTQDWGSRHGRYEVPHPDIPRGTGPSPPNRKLQETSSLYPDVDFSTDSSPNNPKAIFATCWE